MAVRRRRGAALRRAKARLRRTAWTGGAVAVLALALTWQTVWPYVVGVVLVGLLGGVGWWLWRTHLRTMAEHRAWRAEEENAARERSMAEIDTMTWQRFERYVAELCRRDGCTHVIVSGKSGDLGADVVGRMPDGRRLVIQCKHYAPHRTVPSGDMQKFLGTAKAEHGADVAVFVATCDFTRAAERLAVKHEILAMHRNLLGAWVRGATLESLIPLNGTGNGGRPRSR
ncbi:restriction endonuclease [Streptomyces malaysiensis]|uniref:Restriction endonuclease n=1 Tax=Streptomyces malaysiensis subsp. samsunensis TaxID=459658 RepID=A0A9X2LVV8_STRMQ|nr:restriction endonuclease [Streptomyces samsunensis]MCQ8830557.1 restriction endonuclease [Streptomyces samsunensis]